MQDFGGVGLEDLGGKMVSMGYNITSFKAIELLSHCNSKKRLPILWMEFIICPWNKGGLYVHILITRFGASSWISSTKFVCVLCSQPKEVSRIPKPCWFYQR